MSNELYFSKVTKILSENMTTLAKVEQITQLHESEVQELKDRVNTLNANFSDVCMERNKRDIEIEKLKKENSTLKEYIINLSKKLNPQLKEDKEMLVNLDLALSKTKN